jgi:hypothetical protein
LPDGPAITVWRLGRDPEPWPPPEREPYGRPAITYVPIDPHTRWPDVVDYLKRVPDEAFDLADAVVVRTHDAEFKTLERDSARIVPALSRRVRGVPLWVLHWDGAHRLRRLTHDGEEPVEDLAARDDVIPALRTAELRMLVDRPGILLEEHNEYHYEAPNGKHYRRFVRVGLALQTLASLDAVSFWLLDQLQDDPVILTGSGLITLGLAAKRYAAARGIGSPANIGNVEHLLHHGETREPRPYLVARLGTIIERHRPRHRFTLLRRRATEPPRLLVLLSVSDSGGARQRLLDLGGELGLPTRAVALFVAPDYKAVESETVLAEVERPLDSHKPKDCPFCDEDSVPVTIVKSTLLMEVLAESKEVTLDRRHTDPARAFCDRYKGSDALRVHWTEQDDRHHGIDVDVNRLVDHPAFQERLHEELDEWRGRVDVVLSPEHRAARRLAELARSDLGLDETAVVSIDPKPLPRASHEGDPRARRLEAASRILIVDDATITGRRVLQYQEHLRRARLFHHGDEVMVLFGVARPMSERVIDGLRDSTRSPQDPTPDVRSVEALALPYWKNEACPWCQEKRLLDSLDRDPAVARRLDELDDTTRGLPSERVFAQSPGLPLTLGEGSFLGDRTPLETMFCIASGIQSLRNEGALRREHRFPVADALEIRASVERFIDAERLDIRYFEGILSSAILRACGPYDITNPIAERPLREKVTAVLEDPEDPRRVEYALAMAQRKLPLVVTDATSQDPLSAAYVRAAAQLSG